MEKAIFISIKPIHLSRIVSKIKNYEFRNYYPKQEIKYLYVYESYPTCSLKYIIELGEIIEKPAKITKEGYGNSEFNNKLLKEKYAYEIKHLFSLEKPICLKELKEKYHFNPPQSYAYDERYPILTSYIKDSKLKQLF